MSHNAINSAAFNGIGLRLTELEKAEDVVDAIKQHKEGLPITGKNTHSSFSVAIFTPDIMHGRNSDRQPLRRVNANETLAVKY